jgi:hypothetical protein
MRLKTNHQPPQERLRRTITSGGLHGTTLEFPATLHPHSLKTRVLHFAFESALYFLI